MPGYLLARALEIHEDQGREAALLWIAVHAWFESALDTRAALIRDLGLALRRGDLLERAAQTSELRRREVQPCGRHGRVRRLRSGECSRSCSGHLRWS